MKRDAGDDSNVEIDSIPEDDMAEQEPSASRLSQIVEDEREVARLMGTSRQNNPRLGGRFFFYLGKSRGKLTDLRARMPSYAWVLLYGIHGHFIPSSDGVYVPWLMAVMDKCLRQLRREVTILDVVPNPAERSCVLVLVASETEAEILRSSLHKDGSFLRGRSELWDRFVTSDKVKDLEEVVMSGLCEIVHFREKALRHFQQGDAFLTERQRLTRNRDMAMLLGSKCRHITSANGTSTARGTQGILPVRDTARQEPDLVRDSLLLLGCPSGMAEGALCSLFYRAMNSSAASGGASTTTAAEFCPFRVKAIVFHSSKNHAAIIFEPETDLTLLCQRWNYFTSTYQLVVAMPYHTMYRYQDPFPRKRPTDLGLIEEYVEARERFECVQTHTSAPGQPIAQIRTSPTLLGGGGGRTSNRQDITHLCSPTRA